MMPPPPVDGSDGDGGGDVLIHLGDFCNKGSREDAIDFSNWITNLAINNNTKKNHQFSEIYIIDGNHDRTLTTASSRNQQQQQQQAQAPESEPEPEEPPLNLQELFSKVSASTNGKVRFLQDEFVVTKDGLGIYGASWKTCETGQFPTTTITTSTRRVDIMLAHINPCISSTITKSQLLLSSVGGRRRREDAYKGWLGSKNLSKMVLTNNIPLCLTGHIHWSRGMMIVHNNNNNVPTTTTTTIQDDDISSSSSTFINAATLQSGGILAKPVVIDYDLILQKPIKIDNL